jgi:hypothetical protein
MGNLSTWGGRVAAGPKLLGPLWRTRPSAANGCASKIKRGKRQKPHRFQMKMIFKKNQPKRASLRASAERRESEEYFRPFDKVAYAAVLEIMG